MKIFPERGVVSDFAALSVVGLFMSMRLVRTCRY